MRFRDIESGTYRKAGDLFEVTPERLRALNSTRYGQLAEEVEEVKEAPQRAKRTRKAKE